MQVKSSGDRLAGCIGTSLHVARDLYSGELVRCSVYTTAVDDPEISTKNSNDHSLPDDNRID